MKETRTCRKCRQRLEINFLEYVNKEWRCVDDTDCKRPPETRKARQTIEQKQEEVKEVLNDLNPDGEYAIGLETEIIDFTEDDVLEEKEEFMFASEEGEYKRKYKVALKLIEQQEKTIEMMKATAPKQPRKILYPSRPESNSSATAVLMLSDLHFGSIIDGDYVKGTGYNPKMAAKFMDTIVEATQVFIDERQASVPVDELVILLGGDLVEVLDHGQGQLEIMDQLLLAQDLLHDTIKRLSKNVDTRVVVVSGNHDRLNHFKRTPTDNRTRRSYDWLIANNLQRWSPSVHFSIEEAYCAEFKVKGFDCILHHGDAIKGGGGVGGIAPALMRWHYRRNQMKRFDYAFLGHWHSSQIIDGNIFINGCLSGDSGYTQQLGLKSTRCQNLIFIDSEHGFNGFNRINLK